jgi:NADPH:quinone reductase-like Zn-dependent oxidoreductase
MSGYDKIVAEEFGGPDVLKLVHIDNLPEPAAGEARIRVEAAGVGYTDTIVRRGRYIDYKGGLPLTPGYDVVGIIDKIGPGESALKVGDRVADMPVAGAYSRYMIRPLDTLIPVPDGVGPDAAITVPLMGMTAWQMLKREAPLPAGSTILVVGASGAVGRPMVRLARHLGLTVIGTCSTRNVPLVEQLGAIALDYDRFDLLEAIRAATGRKGVAAAFDAIGVGSWETSWNALAPGGKLIGYGFLGYLESDLPTEEAVRVMTRFHQTWNRDGQTDGTRRSTAFYDIRVRRGTHAHEYRDDAVELLGLIARGVFVPDETRVLPLSQAADAHRLVAQGGLGERLVLRP